MAGFNNFAALAAAIPQVLAAIVADTARAGEQNVKDQIEANGQIESGFMYSAIYHKTVDESTYGQAISPPKDAYLLPEVDAPPDNQTAYIAAGADYSIFPNNGTRYQPARPFFEPGIDRTQEDLDANLGTFETRLQRLI